MIKDQSVKEYFTNLQTLSKSWQVWNQQGVESDDIPANWQSKSGYSGSKGWKNNKTDAF